MTDPDDTLAAVTRRHFFRRGAAGIGTLALASLLDRKGLARSHFAPKAKNVIYLFMAGAPSQLDLFEAKPKLNQWHGRKCPAQMLAGERFSFIRGVPDLLGSPFPFKRHGASGLEISSLLPHLATVADDIALVRSVHTTEFNHAPAQIYMNTGHQLIGRPSIGSWLSYGLGTDNQDLPGFIVLVSGKSNPQGGKSCWGNGFLPTFHQGVELRSRGDAVLFLSNPPGVTPRARRASLDLVRYLNEVHLQQVQDPEILARIRSYEMAYQMQTSVPELMDIAAEPRAMHEMYGTEPGKMSFANNCLLARRLVERGVRFVQLYHCGWDHHGDKLGEQITDGLPELCRQSDRAAAALIRDLKQRGLLDTTLVIWGGEFGRTPMREGVNGSPLLGRDHHARAFSVWLAGGGIKAGITLGTTDELGYRPIEDSVSVHDLHATLLHLLGLDHTRLTYRFQGRDFRLTDVEGNIVKKLLA